MPRKRHAFRNLQIQRTGSLTYEVQEDQSVKIKETGAEKPYTVPVGQNKDEEEEEITSFRDLVSNNVSQVEFIGKKQLKGPEEQEHSEEKEEELIEEKEEQNAEKDEALSGLEDEVIYSEKDRERDQQIDYNALSLKDNRYTAQDREKMNKESKALYRKVSKTRRRLAQLERKKNEDNDYEKNAFDCKKNIIEAQADARRNYFRAISGSHEAEECYLACTNIYYLRQTIALYRDTKAFSEEEKKEQIERLEEMLAIYQNTLSENNFYKTKKRPEADKEENQEKNEEKEEEKNKESERGEENGEKEEHKDEKKNKDKEHNKEGQKNGEKRKQEQRKPGKKSDKKKKREKPKMPREVFDAKMKQLNEVQKQFLEEAAEDLQKDKYQVRSKNIKIGIITTKIEAYNRLIKSVPEEDQKTRNKLYREKEELQIKRAKLKKQIDIAGIDNLAEQSREDATFKRHEKYDRYKKLFYSPSKLAIEGAEFDHEGKHLVNIGRAFMGGTKPMYYFEDRNAPIKDRSEKIIGYKVYLYKEAVSCYGRKKPARALVTEAASRLQAIVCKGHEINAFAAMDEKGTIMGSFQEFVKQKHEDQRIDLFKWQANPDNSLSAETKNEILREHTLDWLLCNFDTKGENFLDRDEGGLSSFDKEASFSFIKDPGAQVMSETYNPHSNITLYNTLFQEYIKGTLDLDFQPVLDRAREVQAMKNEDYMGLFEEMLREKYKKEKDYVDVYGKILRRKTELVDEYTRFFGELTRKREEYKKAQEEKAKQPHKEEDSWEILEKEEQNNKEQEQKNEQEHQEEEQHEQEHREGEQEADKKSKKKSKVPEASELDNLYLNYEWRLEKESAEEKTDGWILNEEKTREIDRLLAGEKNLFTERSNSQESTAKNRNEALARLKKGDVSRLNHVPMALKEYYGRKRFEAFFGDDYKQTGKIPELDEDMKERLKGQLLDPLFRYAINLLVANKACDKEGNPIWETLAAYDKYMNHQILVQTLNPPSEEERQAILNKFPQKIFLKGQDDGQTMLNNWSTRQGHMAKILFLGQLGRFDQYDTSDKEETKAGTFQDYMSEAVGHGARVAFTFPPGTSAQQTAIQNAWKGNASDVMYSRFATHEFNRRQVDANGKMTKPFHEIRLKGMGASKWKYLKGDPEEKPTGYVNNYGMNIALGGMGKSFNNNDIVDDQGRFAHVYQRMRKGDKTHCGTLLFGIENSAPSGAINIRKHFGGYDGRSAVGQCHNRNAFSHDTSPFFSHKNNVGDKIGGREVDLSHVKPEDLVLVMNEFDRMYRTLQEKASVPLPPVGNTRKEKREREHAENNRRQACADLNTLNELLAGGRLSANKLYYLLRLCGIQRGKAKGIISDARSVKDAAYAIDHEKYPKGMQVVENENNVANHQDIMRMLKEEEGEE